MKPYSSAISSRISWCYACRSQWSAVHHLLTKDSSFTDYLQIFRLKMTIQRKLAATGVLVLATMYVTTRLNRRSSHKLMRYRSIVASVIRLVATVQGQAAGLALPTDVDGKYPVPHVHFSNQFQLNRNRKPSPPNRSSNIPPLLEHARSRYLPHRHQPALHLLPLHQAIPTILRRQHPRPGLAPLTALARLRRKNAVVLFQATAGRVDGVA